MENEYNLTIDGKCWLDISQGIVHENYINDKYRTLVPYENGEDAKRDARSIKSFNEDVEKKRSERDSVYLMVHSSSKTKNEITHTKIFFAEVDKDSKDVSYVMDKEIPGKKFDTIHAFYIALKEIVVRPEYNGKNLKIVFPGNRVVTDNVKYKYYMWAKHRFTVANMFCNERDELDGLSDDEFKEHVDEFQDVAYSSDLKELDRLMSENDVMIDALEDVTNYFMRVDERGKPKDMFTTLYNKVKGFAKLKPTALVKRSQKKNSRFEPYEKKNVNDPKKRS